MKIGDLVQLLNNRLREFQLSRDYARMSGDLERMNAADKEISALEDTLYQLNLLVDTSKSAAVRETTLAEVITDGSVAVLSEYDITPYATDPLHEEKTMNILSNMGVMETVEKIDEYIKGKYVSSPVTGEMIVSAASAYSVDARLMMAIMEQDSRFGTVGVAVRTLNPGNVGNDDSGNTRTYESWQEGVTAVAEWLNRHRISKDASETPGEVVLEPTATSTLPTITPMATSTPTITTSTTTTVTTSTSSPQVTIPITATSTPFTSTTSTTTTPVIATSTPTIFSTTTATSTDSMSSTSTPETIFQSPPDTTAGEAEQATSTDLVQATTTEETTATSTSPQQATTTN